MRKIEQDLLAAIRDGRTWHGSNTSCSSIDDVNYAVFLHGNHIADVNRDTGFVMVNKYTLSRWPTVTTKSRLRALGVNVYTRDYVIYLDNERV